MVCFSQYEHGRIATGRNVFKETINCPAPFPPRILFGDADKVSNDKNREAGGACPSDFFARSGLSGALMLQLSYPPLHMPPVWVSKSIANIRAMVLRTLRRNGTTHGRVDEKTGTVGRMVCDPGRAYQSRSMNPPQSRIAGLRISFLGDTSPALTSLMLTHHRALMVTTDDILHRNLACLET